MKRQYWFLLVALFMTVWVVGCSGSGNDITDGDEDGDSVEDSDQDQDDVDGDEDGDEDGDSETDGDCTCSEENACCDGCNPINQDGECDDSNLCTENDKCNAGVCEGTEITCEAKVCYEEDASCNPSTGECEYTMLENGTECEATEGLLGSGLCLEGECGGFGSCDSRAYNQPFGYVCNYDSECESHFCYGYTDPLYSFTFKYCSQKCGEGESPCPVGTKCVNKGGSLGHICEVFNDFWTDFPLTFPQDGTNELYAPCRDENDCEGGVCLVTHDGSTFCSKDCSNEAGTGPDGSLCGACGSCETTPEGSSIDVPYYCSMDGKNEAGQSCGSSLDCGSGLCINNYCSAVCFDVEGMNTCPDGYSCVPEVYNTSVCVLESESDTILKPIGGECTEDRWCASKNCRDGICSADCNESACEEGECVESDTPIEVNTVITLYKDGVEEALATDDNSGISNFSLLTYDFTEAGTYYIDVAGKYDTTEGPYYLFLYSGEASGFTEIDETEPNNDQQNAMEITDEKVKIAASLAAGEHDVFAFNVTIAPARVEFNVYTAPFFDKICAADTAVASKGYGESCNDTYECSEDRICFEGSCTEECTEDEDCQNGICFAYYQDYSLCVAEDLIGTLEDGVECYINYQCEEFCLSVSQDEIYCSRECTDDDDCIWGMGCDQGYCLNGAGTTYPYNDCRFDADCDAGNSCINGKCSSNCDDDADCEGSAEFDASQYEMCWPCETSADCNEGGETSPNICLNSPNGTSFCSTPCDLSPMVCPEDSRCFDIGSFFPQHVCAPTSLSCEGQASCSTSGDDSYCIRPTLSDYQPCTNADNCWGGYCENDLCQSDTCSSDADCGCEYLSCEGNYCAVAAGDGIMEVEDNDEIANAQVISENSAMVVASLSGENGPDVDIYKVSMEPGEFLDVQTKAFCEFAADTYLRLLDDQGNLIGEWENDDIDPNGDYLSVLLGYKANTTEDVFIEVSQSSYVAGVLHSGYILDIDIFVPDTNTTCDNAKELTEGYYEDNFDAATHDYLAGACAEYSSAGKDLTYYIDVPANKVLRVALDADFYIQVSLVTDCEDIEKSCLDGVTLTEPGTVPVEAKWANEGTETVRVIMIVDHWLTDLATDFSLDISLADIVTPDNNTGDGAISVPHGSSSFDINTYGATNDYDPGVDGCSAKALLGRDVVYTFDLEPGEYVIAKTSGDYPTDMYLVTDYSDLSSCVKYASNSLVYMEEAPTKAVVTTYYLIVDSASEDLYGEITIDFTIDSEGVCSGVCDPATYENICISPEKADMTILCKCDSSINMYEKQDCNQFCMDNGYLGGVCNNIALDDGYSQCICESDCADVQDQCTINGGVYTNCTCAASDPCEWQADGTCDEKCAAFYPDDHFDDSADCVSE